MAENVSFFYLLFSHIESLLSIIGSVSGVGHSLSSNSINPDPVPGRQCKLDSLRLIEFSHDHSVNILE